MGTVYTVDLDRISNGIMVCGGCGRKLRGPIIWVRRLGTEGWLPAELFELPSPGFENNPNLQCRRSKED